jgi:hypothetical protein
MNYFVCMDEPRKKVDSIPERDKHGALVQESRKGSKVRPHFTFLQNLRGPAEERASDQAQNPKARTRASGLTVCKFGCIISGRVSTICASSGFIFQVFDYGFQAHRVQYRLIQRWT